MGWLTTTLRRSLLLVLVAAAGGAVWSWRRDAADASSPAPPTWPPLSADTPHSTSTAASAADSVSVTTKAPMAEPEARSDDGSAGGWVEPMDDGSCPVGYPVKANDNSGIFHLPDGRFYDRTKPERCYSDADAASADGYRRAKN